MRKFFIRSLPAPLLLALLAMLQVSCGGGNGGDGTPPDTTPPTVTSTSPADGATDVGIDNAVTVIFSEEMDATTVNESNFTVTIGGAPVAGTVLFTGETATFTPASPFGSKTTYTATVSTGVKDLAGNAMAEDYIWTFTTVETFSTFTGTVSGTLVLAVDENGMIAAQDETSGKTPDTDGHYPFSLTVPDGHEYTIYFVMTADFRIVPLYSGTTNIFSVTGGGTIDLGYVDTTQPEATAQNDPLTSAGVTSEGETGPDTISVEGSNPLLLLIDRADVGRKYRTQVQVKNPDGSVLENGALVKDVIVYDPGWQGLPLDGNFYYFDALTMYIDNGIGPAPSPDSDVEAYLAASPPSLTDGFYTELITDSNRNLHMVTFYYEPPTEVEKPLNLAQNVNTDNSITLTWTNPGGISGPGYVLRLEIRHSDENGDGFTDLALNVILNSSANMYTIPASFVSSSLAGKQDLIWKTQVRQVAGPILFPDGSTRTVQIYRNYSADQALSLP